MRAFVAGATGYTGREVVRQLVENGVETIAHVRPDSNSLQAWTQKFEGMGAAVDATKWQPEDMHVTIKRLLPDVVFCLVGTTRARRAGASDRERETYEAVDYGLTAILIEACQAVQPQPAFVYLSSMGVSSNSPSSYIQARWRAEEKLMSSGLRYLIARPSFISGEGRDEARPLERMGAVLTDGALGILGVVGLGSIREKYASMNNVTLAGGLVSLSLDGFEAVVVEADALRAAAGV